MLVCKDLSIKLKFLFIYFFSVIMIQAFLRLLPLNSVIKKTKNISRFVLSLNKSEVSIEKLHSWSLKLNDLLGIKSCFTSSLIKKIIFSFFGHELLIVCGVKFDEESNFNGHAWLCYKDKVVFEESESLKGYIESFKI